MPGFSLKSFFLSLQPTQAWVAILGLASFISIVFLVHGGRFLIPVFPLGSLAVGIFLYIKAPALYIGFALWISFLAPFIRRVIDYQSGYLTPGPWGLAASLVTSVSIFTLLRFLPKSYKLGGLPFILSISSVFYGFLISIIQGNLEPDKSIVVLLGWLGPLCFGFHLFINWRKYPSYRQTIQQTFLWGVFIMGVYGVIQFLVVPPWDRFFLNEYDGLTSAGKPIPLGVNVWSTMGSPGTFAFTMRAGLLLIFTTEGSLFLPASLVGYLSFLLAKKRTAWASWLLGFLILIGSSKAKFQMRLAVIVSVMALCLIPLISMDSFSDNISSRFDTFLNLEGDASANARQDRYGDLLGLALSSFTGKGIGAKSFDVVGNLPFDSSLDSAILATLLQLGWFGTIFYISGLILLLVSLFQGSVYRLDPFLNATLAISVSSIAQVPFSMPFLGEEGTILWGFLGISMAAKKYYYHQRTTEIRSSL